MIIEFIVWLVTQMFVTVMSVMPSFTLLSGASDAGGNVGLFMGRALYRIDHIVPVGTLVGAFNAIYTAFLVALGVYMAMWLWDKLPWSSKAR